MLLWLNCFLLPENPGGLVVGHPQTSFTFEGGQRGTAPVETTLAEWTPELWRVAPDWRALVELFLVEPEGVKLADFVRERLAAGATIFPAQPLRALDLTPLSQVKVVILGQDPYHGAGQAEGLAFSVASDSKVPPSLRNIFKEIKRDAAIGPAPPKFPTGGSLVSWAAQGVLLLNTCLTVEEGLPASHAHQGWEVLTRAIIRAVASQTQSVVFMLWGAHAQATAGLIQTVDIGSHHLVLTANHPSPLSALRPPAPFIGCGHFSAANHHLVQKKRAPIDWYANV